MIEDVRVDQWVSLSEEFDRDSGFNVDMVDSMGNIKISRWVKPQDLKEW